MPALLLLLLPSLASAMDVQGTLPTTDTVWKKDLSPYVLTGDVTVPWGAKLTVEAGVQIIAIPEDALRSGADMKRVELIVDGTLLVRGTPSQPVRFTSHGSPGSWYGVRVRGGRGTVIDGALLEQTTQGISLGMSAVVKNTVVSALAADCLQVTSAWGTPSLQGNDLSGCGGRERGSPSRPSLPPEARVREEPPPPPPPVVRERPSPPRPVAIDDTPAPRVLPKILGSSSGGECAIEPQMNEPPACPGVRRWRKDQAQLGAQQGGPPDRSVPYPGTRRVDSSRRAVTP
ncbi:MAG: hypothetical protein ABW123_12265 [Cystobacter sp.]